MPHRRPLLKWAKWTGTCAAALVAATWLVSHAWNFWWRPGVNYSIQLHKDAVSVSKAGAWYGSGGFVSPPSVSTGNISSAWTFRRAASGWVLVIPFWTPFAITACTSAALWWWESHVRRRERSRSCRVCDYSLNGLRAGTPCPECGTSTAPSSAVPTHTVIVVLGMMGCLMLLWSMCFEMVWTKGHHVVVTIATIVGCFALTAFVLVNARRLNRNLTPRRQCNRCGFVVANPGIVRSPVCPECGELPHARFGVWPFQR